jgi:hypothetical protein
MNTARKLTARLAELLHHEHAAMADFLVALAAFDRERHWETLGYKSVFGFLHRELGLSKSAAFYRKTAAELIGDYPEVLEALRDGRLCVTSVAEVAKVITPENRTEVLPRYFTLSSREAKEVTAELLPVEAPPLREVVTVVQAPAPALSLALPPATADLPPSSGSAPNHSGANSRVPDVSPAPVAPSVQAVSFDIEPLTADLRRLHLTVSKDFLDKLEAARNALSHSHPGASRDEIIEVGLMLILERAAKRRGFVKNPRKNAAPSAEPASPGKEPPAAAKDPGRYVAADVRRAIWERDRAQCQWAIDGGGICGSMYQVEVDHSSKPFAKGGRILKPEDGRLLCRPHQLVSARREFGDACMDKFMPTRARRGPQAASGERPSGGGERLCEGPAARADVVDDPAAGLPHDIEPDLGRLPEVREA